MSQKTLCSKKLDLLESYILDLPKSEYMSFLLKSVAGITLAMMIVLRIYDYRRHGEELEYHNNKLDNCEEGLKKLVSSDKKSSWKLDSVDTSLKLIKDERNMIQEIKNQRQSCINGSSWYVWLVYGLYEFSDFSDAAHRNSLLKNYQQKKMRLIN